MREVCFVCLLLCRHKTPSAIKSSVFVTWMVAHTSSAQGLVICASNLCQVALNQSALERVKTVVSMALGQNLNGIDTN